MKTILLSSNTSWYLLNFRYELMKILKEKGYRVVGCASEDEFSKEIQREFEFIPIKNLDRKGTNPFRDFILFLEYLTVYRKIEPKIVLNFTIKPCIYSSLACQVLNIPYVSVITGLGYTFVKDTWLTKLVSFLYRLSLRSVCKVIFQNPDDMKTFMDRRIIGKSKVALIPGEGVNTSYFSPEFCEDVPKSEKPVFLMISRLLWDKGILQLVSASKMLREKGYDFEVWLLGTIDKGNPSEVPEEKIRSWEEEGLVKYLGFARDVRTYLYQCSCFVLPSYYREGIPRSLVEAMAMGKPIITTDVPGCREVCVDGLNGFLVEPKNVESLAYAMERFLKLSKEEREKMGMEGRKLVVENFSSEKVIGVYLDIIETCAG